MEAFTDTLVCNGFNLIIMMLCNRSDSVKNDHHHTFILEFHVPPFFFLIISLYAKRIKLVRPIQFKIY